MIENDDYMFRTYAQKTSEALAIRVEQQIRVCLKPKPKFIPEKIWLKLASKFIYIEKTQPSMRLVDTKSNPNDTEQQ